MDVFMNFTVLHKTKRLVLFF